MKKTNDLLPVASGATFAASILILYIQQDLLFSYGVIETFYVMTFLISMLPITDTAISWKIPRLKGYPSAAFLSLLIISMIIDFKFLIPVILQLISLFFIMRYLIIGNARRKYHFGYVLFIIFIFFISSLGRIVLTENIPQIYVFNFTDDANLLGIPLIFQGGLTFSSPLFLVFSISIQFTAILLAIGFFLMENFREIIYISNNGKKSAIGIFSMSFTLLSCQCETITSVIPAFSAELLGVISTPLIIESLVLIAGTFILIKTQLNGHKITFFDKLWDFNPVSSIIVPLLILLLIFSPVLLTIVSILGLQTNLFIYFSTNLGVFMISYIFFLIFDKLVQLKSFTIGKKINKAFLTVLVAILMIVWYFPGIVSYVTLNGFAYGLMGVTSFVSGYLLFLLTRSMERNLRSVIYEFITGMVPLLFAVAFYFLAVTNIPIWYNYSLADQLVFTLSVLGITLVPMWISVNYSIYVRIWHNKS